MSIGFKVTDPDAVVDYMSIPSQADVITDNFNNLNLGLKDILTVALSPVVLVGVIMRLPVWGLKHLRIMIKNEMLMRNFEKGNEKDKNKVIKEYRENVISKLTENSIINSCLESQLTILYQYIDNQKQKVIGQIDGKIRASKPTSTILPSQPS